MMKMIKNKKKLKQSKTNFVSGNTYAFINNGRLTILDRNETNVGRVLSSTVAIKNNEFLQIGENEDPLSVSDMMVVKVLKLMGH